MTVPSVSYVRYAPEHVNVENITIGVSTGFNLTPGFSENQYLAVGEFQAAGANESAFNLFVDNEGVSIRSPIPNRATRPNEYALFVDGDVFVTGKVIASNMLQQGSNSSGNGFVVLNEGAGGDSFWSLSSGGIANNLYYPDKVTLGNVFQARTNQHTLNIARSADVSVDHLQLAIQNQQNAQLRIGIIGDARQSPAVINTPAGTSLEFHVGRDQSYFERVYTQSNDQGQNVVETTITNVPVYANGNRQDAPHILVDPSGRVGIHTSSIPPLSFEIRRPDPIKPQEVKYFPALNPMELHVEGSFYGCNIVMWDYESSTTKHLDELYVRRKGVTIPANQIEPGPFAHGYYQFRSNISIMGALDETKQLKVHGDAAVTNDLEIDGTTTTGQLVANDSILMDIANFEKDAYFNKDIIINNSIRVRGQIFVETPSYDVTDGQSNYGWTAVDFAASGAAATSINQIGQGIATPGRFGVGISGADAVNHQTTIIKRDPGGSMFKHMFELELKEQSSTQFVKAAWIGHPRTSAERMLDGSLVIATPSAYDQNYAGMYARLPQNIYMFPGVETNQNATQILTDANKPTLGVFHTKKVGILTYDPEKELDVRGSISFSDSMFLYDTDTLQYLKLGLWKARDFNELASVGGASSTFRGIIYQDATAPYVGIMASPQSAYSLRVGGLLKTDGYFTQEDRKLAEWYDGRWANNNSNHCSPDTPYSVFTWGKTGVGVKYPGAMLSVKDNFESPLGTQVQLLVGDRNSKKATSIAFIGNDESYLVQHLDTRSVFEVGRQEHLADNAAPRAIWTRYNTSKQQYQVVIANNLYALDTSSCNLNPDIDAALTVGGDLSVIGNVNITGEFKVNTRSVGSNDTVPFRTPDLESDDVFIGGGHIVLSPAASKAVIIGSPINISTTEIAKNPALATKSMLRVYQPNDGSVGSFPIATFGAQSKNALIELVALTAAGSNTKLRFGVINDNTLADVPFAFLDGNNNAYLAFKNANVGSESRYFVGFGIASPNANCHIFTKGSGTSMLRLTKLTNTNDTTSACPEVELEKTYNGLNPTKWVIKGPDASHQEKLSMWYSDNNTPVREVFTFTNNGCIGLNNPTPTYALDVKNTGSLGTLRLWNTQNQAASPQLIMQSGHAEFGLDESYDFLMSACNNMFNFNMQNNTNTLPILNVNSNGFIGMRGPASSNYAVEVHGSFNVTDKIYVNGVSIIDGTGTGNGTAITSPSIYLLPNPAFNGGVFINRNNVVGNLFYVYSGRNANLMVLDSLYEENQIHMRVQQNGMGGGIFNMWRLAASNTQFNMSYFPNCGDAVEVNAGRTGYSNAVQLGITQDTSRRGEIDMSLWGQVTLRSAFPRVVFNTNGYIGGHDSNTYIVASSNVGIGTTVPVAALHVHRSVASANPVMRVQQAAGTGDMLQVVGSTSATALVVQANGNVGIGTSTARGALHVASGQILAPNGSATAPSLSFAAWPSTGLFVSSSNSVAVCTNGVSRMNFLSNGDWHLGATVSRGQYTISSNTPYQKTLLSVFQTGDGNILDVSSEIGKTGLVVANNGFVGVGTTPSSSFRMDVDGTIRVNGSVVPKENGSYDLGSPSERWKDIYLSGNSMYLGNTKASTTNAGDFRFQDINNPNTLRGVVADKIQLGDTSINPSLTQVTLSVDDINIVSFSRVKGGTTCNFYPLLGDADTNSITVGDTTRESALSVGAGVKPGIAIEQNSSFDHLQLWTSNSLRTVINNVGNIGIGTAVAMARLSIKSDGGDMVMLLPYSSNFSPTVVDSNGNLGVHITRPAVALHVVGSNIFDGRSTFTSNVYMATNLEVYGNTLTHGNSVTDSDIRLKTDLQRIDSALDRVCGLTGYTFTRIQDQVRSTGLIAQDVEKVLPEAVSYGGAFLGLSYGNMMGLVVEAIKELRQEVSDLKKQYA